MAEQPSYLEDELITLINESSTGLVDVRLEKKRWRFFFKEGDVVASQSNLKSEQAESIQAARPGLSGDRLNQAVLTRRLRSCLRSEEATWTVSLGLDAPEELKHNAAGALFRAILAARSEDVLFSRILPVLKGKVSATPAWSELGLSSSITDFIAPLDGSKTGKTVLEEGASNRHDVLRTCSKSYTSDTSEQNLQ